MNRVRVQPIIIMQAWNDHCKNITIFLFFPSMLQRGQDYSDAYDGDQPEAQQSGLLINPAVAEVVASKAGMVQSNIIPNIVVTRRPVKHCLKQLVN